MKSYLPVCTVAALFAVVAPAIGAANYGTTRANPNTRTYTTTQYETRSYSNSGNYGMYGGQNDGYVMTQPANQTQTYGGYNSGATTRTTTTTKNQTVRRTMKRKYYLAHPFFQPTEGKFGSITDLGYNTASYNFNITPAPGVTLSDTSAKWSMKQFALKEDLSFGITDKIGLLLMGRYDSSKYKFDWSADPDDEMEDSGFNILGGGVQARIVDNSKIIATLSAYYERQSDIANEYVADFKLGYKVSKSTIYGLARAWLVNFDDEMYGNGAKGKTSLGYEEALFLSYDDDAEWTFFIEGGIGIFSVLSEDWTLNVEALVGSYDWHNQSSIKFALGWQPNDWFALNLYAKTAFYDSADGKKLDYYQTESGIWGYGGEAELDKYKETSIGGQVIFYF